MGLQVQTHIDFDFIVIHDRFPRLREEQPQRQQDIYHYGNNANTVDNMFHEECEREYELTCLETQI